MPCQSCCKNKKSVRKGRWSPEEDKKLRSHITRYGVVYWSLVPSLAGSLNRCGKSCRLRWLNYLRPGLRTHEFNAAEIALILNMQSIVGNRWCKIAKLLPGRTDNQVKNFWNCYIKPRQQALSTGHEIAPNQQQQHPPLAPADAENHSDNVGELVHKNNATENGDEIPCLVESYHEQHQHLDYCSADDPQWNSCEIDHPLSSSIWDYSDFNVSLP